MNTTKLIEENVAKSAALYLQRQQLQMQLQQVQMAIQQVEANMLKLDGEAELLNRIKEEEKPQMELVK